MRIIKFKNGIIFKGFIGLAYIALDDAYTCSKDLKTQCHNCAHICYMTCGVSAQFRYFPNNLLMI